MNVNSLQATQFWQRITNSLQETHFRQRITNSLQDTLLAANANSLQTTQFRQWITNLLQNTHAFSIPTHNISSNPSRESQIRCRTHKHFQFQHIIYHQIPAKLHGFNMNTHMHFQFQHTFVIKSQQSHMILTWTHTCIFLHNAFQPTPLLWPALYQVLFFPFYSLSLVRCSRNWPRFIFVACPLSCFQFPLQLAWGV